MSCFAQGSRSSLSFGVQSDFTTQASANFTNLPFKTHSLDLIKERLEGADIQADRMPRVDRHGNRNGSGSIEVDLRKGDYDDLIECVMLDTFGANDELTVGTTPQFLTIEDAANDMTQFRVHTGMTANSMAVSIAPNQMVQTTFGMVGRNVDQVQSSVGGTISASSTNAPFDSYNGEIYEGGVGSGDLIESVASINFNVTNSFAPIFVVGADVAPCLEYGRSVIEGELVVYYENETIIDKFLDETESAIQVSVDDPTGTNAYTFLIPRVKYNGGAVPVADPQSRLVTLPFVALYDSSEDTQLKITRSS